jgi:hypothetical protein
MTHTPPAAKTYDELEEAERLFAEAGLTGWSVTPLNGQVGDATSLFRAERPTPNGKREIAHASAEVLVRLAQEADALIASTTSPPVATGNLDTGSYS